MIDWRRAGLVWAAVIAFVGLTAAQAMAQGPPPPRAVPKIELDPPGFLHTASTSALFDLSSRLLWRFGQDAWLSGDEPRGSDDEGGGATPARQVAQRFRGWSEGYAMSTKTRDHDGLPGDLRRSVGGVGGFGFTPVKGANIAFAVDQGATIIDVGGLRQHARIELTQIAGNASYAIGNWTIGVVGIHGFGTIDSRRPTSLVGVDATANYDGRLWAGLAELSYYWSLKGNWRVVPRIAVDWARTHTDSFTETGGPDPATGAAVTVDRTRVFAGVEVGRSWVDNRAVYDVSAYARFVDVVAEGDGALAFTSQLLSGTTRSVIGTLEGPYGVDAGAQASVRFNRMFRLYANYDARLRDNFDVHSGTLGLEVKW